MVEHIRVCVWKPKLVFLVWKPYKCEWVLLSWSSDCGPLTSKSTKILWDFDVYRYFGCFFGIVKFSHFLDLNLIGLIKPTLGQMPLRRIRVQLLWDVVRYFFSVVTVLRTLKMRLWCVLTRIFQSLNCCQLHHRHSRQFCFILFKINFLLIIVS